MPGGHGDEPPGPDEFCARCGGKVCILLALMFNAVGLFVNLNLFSAAIGIVPCNYGEDAQEIRSPNPAMTMYSAQNSLDFPSIGAKALDEQLRGGVLEHWPSFERFFREEIMEHLEEQVKEQVRKSTVPTSPADPADPIHVRIPMTYESYQETADHLRGVPAPKVSSFKDPWNPRLKNGPFWRDSSEVNNVVRVNVVKSEIERLGYRCSVNNDGLGMIWLDVAMP